MRLSSREAMAWGTRGRVPFDRPRNTKLRPGSGQVALWRPVFSPRRSRSLPGASLSATPPPACEGSSRAGMAQARSLLRIVRCSPLKRWFVKSWNRVGGALLRIWCRVATVVFRSSGTRRLVKSSSRSTPKEAALSGVAITSPDKSLKARVKRRFISFCVGHRGWRRTLAMKWMCRLRQKRSTLSRPDLRFIRTIQAPDQVVFNKATERYEFSSQAFSASSTDGSLSGDLEELLVGDGLHALTLYPSIDRAVGVAGFRVEDAVNLGLTVAHEPVKTNWYHGGVRGDLKKKTRQRLKEAATELVPIGQEEARFWQEERDRAAAAKAAASSSSF